MTSMAKMHHISRRQSIDEDLEPNTLWDAILNQFDGKLSFTTFSRTFFKGNETEANDWLENNKRKFIRTFNAKGRVCTITVYSDRAKVCFAYFKVKKCRKENCCYYHVCQENVFGKCTYGSRCMYGHNLLHNSHNKELVKRHGFESLTSDQLTILINFSKLVVCAASCPVDEQVFCTRLHVCPIWLRNNCDEQEEDCIGNHDFGSRLCRNLLKQYKIDYLDDEDIKRFIIVPRSSINRVETSFGLEIEEQHPTENYGRKIPFRDAHTATNGTIKNTLNHHCTNTTQSQKETNTQLTSNTSGDIHIIKSTDAVLICEENLRGACSRGWGCQNHHFTEPFLWQCFHNSKWVSLFHENASIEERYRDPTQDFDFISFRLRRGDKKPTMFYWYEMRRLTTKSYVLSKQHETYATRWVWYWLSDNDNWEVFGSGTYLPLQYTLETKYNEGTMEFSLGMQPKSQQFAYQFDLDSLTQTNVLVNTTRAIRRRPAENNGNQENQEPIPANWSIMEPIRKFTTVSLTEHSDEYKKVKGSFSKSLKVKAQIKEIIRVQNLDLWRMYCAKKAILKKRMKTDEEVERLLFNGTTDPFIVTEICNVNFDCRLHGSHGTRFGKGSYFATTANFSNVFTDRSGNNYQFMFQARVLVGNYTTGKESYVRPPKLDSKVHGSDLYDSCVDRMVNPSMFVVFDLNQCYPQYIIVYQELDNHSGRPVPVGPRPSTNVWSATGLGPSSTMTASSNAWISQRPKSPTLPTSHVSSTTKSTPISSTQGVRHSSANTMKDRSVTGIVRPKNQHSVVSASSAFGVVTEPALPSAIDPTGRKSKPLPLAHHQSSNTVGDQSTSSRPEITGKMRSDLAKAVSARQRVIDWQLYKQDPQSRFLKRSREDHSYASNLTSSGVSNDPALSVARSSNRTLSTVAAVGTVDPSKTASSFKAATAISAPSRVSLVAQHRSQLVKRSHNENKKKCIIL